MGEQELECKGACSSQDLDMWVRPKRERGNQGYWREQMDFYGLLICAGHGLHNFIHAKHSSNTVPCPQLHSG